MEIEKVSAQEYLSVIPKTKIVFNSVAFNELNLDKCDEVHYFLFKDSKYRAGLILGKKNNAYLSPFSAPFGGFEYISKEPDLEQIDNFIKCLDQKLIEDGINSVHLILPPIVYNETFISKLINSFFINQYTTNNIDLSNYFSSENLNEKYDKLIKYSAKKNLKIALKNNFTFTKCHTKEEKLFAYDIIKLNRMQRGFPLKMSFEQVISTSEIIDANFFILGKEKQLVASAIVFKVATDVVQVVYWGDNHDFAATRPMNLLAYKVFEYYKNAGIRIVDIGPSTENSIPNFGLFNFKESIGCNVSLKFSFTKVYQK